MNSETRNCQSCKNDFIIEAEDFAFYDKIKVPAPTFCPTCRFIRRLSFMNIYSLYKSTCNKCDQNIISMFKPDSGQNVFCSKCWWADDWDGTEYGIDYDPNMNFFEQFAELKKKTPCMSLDTLYSSLVKTSYTNYSSHLKNSYALFFADYAENCFYSDFLNTLKDTSDCIRIRESELCYDSIGLYKCFGCIGSEECDNSVNLIFSKNCSGCNDCFGCVNLRKKSYCVFNEQLTKEEYEDFIKNTNLSNYSEFIEYKKKAQDFWLTQPMRYMYGNSLNVNVTGEYAYESKNAKNVYMVTTVEDSKYTQLISVPKTKDAYDYTCWGGNAELIYESLIAGHGAYGIKFSIGSYPDALNNEYSYYASSCKNVFGCANLKKKQYCIFNKEYTKEDFENLKIKIINDMKDKPYIDKMGKVYKYGEFFPSEISAFGYNETFANTLFPETSMSATSLGFKWVDQEINEYKHTILNSDLPDNLDDFKNPLEQIIKCDCGKCYRIVEGELGIIKKLKAPIPRKCSDCRRYERFSRILPNVEYDRNCDNCGINIKTSYSPERTEIVYCEKCYQNEVV